MTVEQIQVKREVFELRIDEIVEHTMHETIYGPVALQADTLEAIERFGVVDPVSVVWLDGRWVLLAGRNRIEAQKRLGKATVPSVEAPVSRTDVYEQIEWLISSNAQRRKTAAQIQAEYRALRSARASRNQIGLESNLHKPAHGNTMSERSAIAQKLGTSDRTVQRMETIEKAKAELAFEGSIEAKAAIAKIDEASNESILAGELAARDARPPRRKRVAKKAVAKQQPILLAVPDQDKALAESDQQIATLARELAKAKEAKLPQDIIDLEKKLADALMEVIDDNNMEIDLFERLIAQEGGINRLYIATYCRPDDDDVFPEAVHVAWELLEATIKGARVSKNILMRETRKRLTKIKEAEK